LLVAVCPASAVSRLPGYSPQRLGHAVVDGGSLKSLVTALHLEGDQITSSHAVLQQYAARLKSEAQVVRDAMASIEPPGAAGAAETEAARLAAMDRVRDDLERRRMRGEFDGDPEALREAWQEAVQEAEREWQEAKQAGDRLPGWADAFAAQAAILADWYDTEDAELAALRSSLVVIAGEERAAAIDGWFQSQLLRRGFRYGRLSGERLDPREVLADCGLTVPESARPAIDEWLIAHAALMQRRSRATRQLPLRASDAVVQGRADLWQGAVETALSRREAVRDHALEGVELIAAALTGPDRVRFTEAARRSAFPGVWRHDRAARALNAALSDQSLSTEQASEVLLLRDDHVERLAHLLALQQDAVLREEALVMQQQDVARARALFGVDQPSAASTPLMDRSRRDRRELSEDSMRRLRSMLDDAQWSRIPGTRTSPVRDDDAGQR